MTIEEKEKAGAEMFAKLSATNKMPEVKERIEHLETAFEVVEPDSGKVICYCESRDEATFLAHAVKLAKDFAVGWLVRKICE